MLICQETLEKVLKPYKPECRYLVEAEFDFPAMFGRFEIPSSFYALEETGHLNAIDLEETG